jgi:hypothetical protein
VFDQIPDNHSYYGKPQHITAKGIGLGPYLGEAYGAPYNTMQPEKIGYRQQPSHSQAGSEMEGKKEPSGYEQQNKHDYIARMENVNNLLVIHYRRSSSYSSCSRNE